MAPLIYLLWVAVGVVILLLQLVHAGNVHPVIADMTEVSNDQTVMCQWIPKAPFFLVVARLSLESFITCQLSQIKPFQNVQTKSYHEGKNVLHEAFMSIHLNWLEYTFSSLS